tara:strand:+ start:601 stop:1158 length:558 start_codon:yes stop_codon:yes gene_type:complete
METRGRECLLPKQKKAVNYFMKGMNKKESLLAAGYSDSVANTDAQSVFDREDVKSEIKRMQQRGQRKAELTSDWITQRLMAIADASVGDILEFKEDGTPYLDYAKMNNDLKYALSGISVRSYSKGRGEGAIPVTEMKVDTADKLRAMDQLARLHAMYEDKVTINLEQEAIAALRQGRARAGLKDD